MTASTVSGCTARNLGSPWASPEARLVLRADAPREEWLRYRRAGIGSSDASAVLGLSKWSSPYEVWAEKRGLLPPDPDNEAMELGRLLEPIVVGRWSATTGIPIKRAGLMVNRDHPFMLASVDRLAACGGIVEAKTLSYRVADEWEDGQTPDHAEVQVQHQMAVTGRDHAHVVGLQDGRTWLERRIDRDDRLIPDLIDIEAEFWRLVTTGEEPPIDGSAMTTDALNARWPALEDVETVLPEEAWDLIRDRAYYLEGVEAHQRAADERANRLRALMGEATVGYLPGQDDVDPKKRKKVIYRRNGTFQRKRFEGEHPDVAAAITHPMPTFDVGALQGGRPDLYAEYRARVLRVPKIEEASTDGG